MRTESIQTAPADTGDSRVLGNQQAQRLVAYADPWTTPPEAFYDIYDLLPRVVDPKQHLQIEGRRGTGKTVLMVNSYLRVRERFEAMRGSPPYTVGIYVDLSQDVGAPRENMPVVRGYLLFRQILQLILTVTSRPGNRRDRRFWGLQDYLEERPQWFRRLWGRWRLDRYRAAVERLGDDMYSHPMFQQILKAQRGLYAPAPKLKAFAQNAPRVAASAMPRRAAGPVQLPQSFRQTRMLPSLVFEKRLVDLYRHFGHKLLDALDPLLDAMQVKNLILFIDEWSGPSIGSDTQPYLFEQLANTFTPDSRVTLKFATVPGATRLAFDSSTTRVTPIYLDQLASFQPHWMRNRLIRMLILNLSASIGPDFPLARYQNETEEKAGYPTFARDVFQNEEALDELVQASESLPRQMLLIFMSAVQLQSIYGARRRLSAAVIRMAARQLFTTQFEVTINHDRVVGEVFAAMLQAGARVVDVERLPVFYEALDWLVNEGVIFRCGSSGQTTGEEAFIRYKLSYPAEVYRLAQGQGAVGPAWFERVRVEPVMNCEQMADPPKVYLSALAAHLFEA